MSHTYTVSLYHLVFSTKHRRADIREPHKLWGYLHGIAANHNIETLAIGGTTNHVHILLALPATMPLAEAVVKFKSNSSRWLREGEPWNGWQEGYGAFSVSASIAPKVKEYIANQKEHHAKHSFEDEFFTLLEKSGVIFERSGVFA